MEVHTFIFFCGDCAEALDFYKGVFDVSIEVLLSYRQAPPELIREGWEDKVFHCTARFGETRLNLSDIHPSERSEFGGFALLAQMASDEAAETAFAALQQEGKVRVPLQPTFWAARYGIVIDKFGITWKIQS